MRSAAPERLMSRSFLAMLSLSFSLEPQPDRRQETDRRSGWRGGRRASDFGDLAYPVAVQSVMEGVSRDTWIHDHDTLEQRYVN
jgi:hypothetical protein